MEHPQEKNSQQSSPRSLSPQEWRVIQDIIRNTPQASLLQKLQLLIMLRLMRAREQRIVTKKTLRSSISSRLMRWASPSFLFSKMPLLWQARIFIFWSECRLMIRQRLK